MTLRCKTDETATFHVSAPMAICLRDGETMTYSAKDCEPWDVYNLVFSPTFINVNMQPAVMEQGVYEVLAETYHLFRLAPFMETHTELKRIDMTEEQMDAYFRICDATVAAMEEEDPDKCWSCRIRAGLMDILTGLEAQYTHKIEGRRDNSLTFATYRNIVILIHGDLMHPGRMEDVCRVFGINKNKLQVNFTPIQRTFLPRFHQTGPRRTRSKLSGLYGSEALGDCLPPRVQHRTAFLPLFQARNRRGPCGFPKEYREGAEGCLCEAGYGRRGGSRVLCGEIVIEYGRTVRNWLFFFYAPGEIVPMGYFIDSGIMLQLK